MFFMFCLLVLVRTLYWCIPKFYMIQYVPQSNILGYKFNKLFWRFWVMILEKLARNCRKSNIGWPTRMLLFQTGACHGPFIHCSHSKAMLALPAPVSLVPKAKTQPSSWSFALSLLYSRILPHRFTVDMPTFTIPGHAQALSSCALCYNQVPEAQTGFWAHQELCVCPGPNL